MPTAIDNLTIDLAFDEVIAGIDAIWDRTDCWRAFDAVMRANPGCTVAQARLAMESIADRAYAADSTLAAAI